MQGDFSEYMNKGMCITYEVESGLYVNVTNRCQNRCEFCIRNNGDGAYGSDSLWLEREPTVEEIIDEILSRDLSKYSEIVFCGYGEPSIRLEECREVALNIKEKYKNMPVRINTNGQSDLYFGKDTAPLYKDAFDSVSISLNTPCAEKYNEICHPVYGLNTFDAILLFAKNVKNFVPNVCFSVVRQTLTEKELLECRAISDDVGIYLKIRDYIAPES